MPWILLCTFLAFGMKGLGIHTKVTSIPLWNNFLNDFWKEELEASQFVLDNVTSGS